MGLTKLLVIAVLCSLQFYNCGKYLHVATRHVLVHLYTCLLLVNSCPSVI